MADKIHPATTITNIKQHVPITLDLDGNTYINWATLFKLHARATLVYDHIIPSKTDSTTPKTLTDAEKAQWSRLDAIVLQWIYGTISTDLLNTIIDQDDHAMDAWNKLADLFHDNKTTRAVHLENEFTNTQLKDFPDVNAYCTRLKTLADQLANVGVKVSDDRMVVKLLGGLGDAYVNFQTHVQQRDVLPTFTKARSMLSLEERTSKQREALSTGSNSALLMDSSTNKSLHVSASNQVDGSGGGTGNRGGRGGRRNYNSRNRGGNNNRNRNSGGGGKSFGQQQQTPRPTATQPMLPPQWTVLPAWPWNPQQWASPPCPYPTQVQPRTPSMHPGLLGPRPPQAHYASASSPNLSYTPTDIDAAMHTLTLNQPDNNWYMDTGATSHMTADSGFTDGETATEM